jgi:hypothetical protein
MNNQEVTMHEPLIAHATALEAAGVVRGPKVDEVLSLFDEVRAMTWRLIHPKNP